jgi:fermentation-respiration switch protein FrsA (DUF1100 family)
MVARYLSIGVSTLVSIAPLASVLAQDRPPVNPGSPPVECRADIKWDRNQPNWPGYLIPNAEERQQCVPFTANYNPLPEGYKGEYYVDEFTDAKARQAWADCVAKGPSCSDPVRRNANGFAFAPPFSVTGTMSGSVRIYPNAEVNLADIRRPAFFGKAPYSEPIAGAEGRTWTVEVEVPSETFEHQKLGVASDKTWKQRGWYIEGSGVDDGRGGRQRMLAVLVGGRSIETMAIHDPVDTVYVMKPETGKAEAVVYPNMTSEKWGLRHWREYLHALNQAGFDILTIDKRAHGISGGLNTSNTLQQARDLYRALDAFETGKGLRLLGPDGTVRAGSEAAGILLAKQRAKEIPVIIGGASQGSMVTAMAMHLNFVADCAWDQATPTCGTPLGYNVKGAIHLAEFAHGLGHTARILTEGLIRSEFSVAYVPTGEVLAGISKWPALFLGRGLWDHAGGLEGALDAYNRVTGPKELVVVRGPHSENEYGPSNVKHMQDRVVAFAQAVARGDKTIPGAVSFGNLKELVASAPKAWEASMEPPRQ